MGATGGAARLRFCGQPITREELELIQEVVENHGLSRNELALTVCELLDWVRPNGKLKGREAFEFLGELEAKGVLKGLPAEKKITRKQKRLRTEAGVEGEPVVGSVRSLKVRLEVVRSRSEIQLWKELVDRYHYLGQKTAFGASLRYLIRHDDGRPLGCLQFSSPALKVACRDRWIGWDRQSKDRHLQNIVQQSRFLILPWVKVKGLASHVLAKVNKQLADDWESSYAVRPVLVETFVDRSRFKGTCYRAANWIHVGETRGRGRMDRDRSAKRVVKSVFLMPLTKGFRDELGAAHGA